MPELAETKVTHRFRSSPERVFDAFVDPTLALRWRQAWSRHLRQASADQGAFEMRVGGGFSALGSKATLRTLDRPKQIAFDWDRSGASSSVALVLEPEPEGPGCVATLYETSPGADSDSMWSALLLAIEDVIERRDIA